MAPCRPLSKVADYVPTQKCQEPYGSTSAGQPNLKRQIDDWHRSLPKRENIGKQLLAYFEREVGSDQAVRRRSPVSSGTEYSLRQTTPGTRCTATIWYKMLRKQAQAPLRDLCKMFCEFHQFLRLSRVNFIK